MIGFVLPAFFSANRSHAFKTTRTTTPFDDLNRHLNSNTIARCLSITHESMMNAISLLFPSTAQSTIHNRHRSTANASALLSVNHLSIDLIKLELFDCRAISIQNLTCFDGLSLLILVRSCLVAIFDVNI
jgi:hypothetical protein